VLLVGDIGGTRARLSLLAPSGRLERHEVYSSNTFRSLEAVVATFLGKRPPKVTAAAFGVAGPVVNGRCVATNLPWVIDARVLSRKLKINRVTLLNDLVALALGAIDVPPSKRRLLGTAGAPRRRGANVAVLAAGTGLGEALLAWDGERLVPSATEGGHVEFGPRTDLEIELLRFCRARFGHVSYERLVSGAGLGLQYDFFCQGQGMRESQEVLDALAAAADRNAAIAKLAADGKSDAAVRAVSLFVSIYGAEAGNLALKTLAMGGVLVCGNIATGLLPVIEQGGFLASFVDKGRFKAMMEQIPVAVVTDADVGLAGCKRVVLGKA
jgi:glucokinase